MFLFVCLWNEKYASYTLYVFVFSRKYSQERLPKDDNRGTEGSHSPFRVKGKVILCRSRSSRRSSPRFAYKWFLWALQVIARVSFQYDHIPCSFYIRMKQWCFVNKRTYLSSDFSVNTGVDTCSAVLSAFVQSFVDLCKLRCSFF